MTTQLLVGDQSFPDIMEKPGNKIRRVNWAPKHATWYPNEKLKSIAKRLVNKKGRIVGYGVEVFQEMTRIRVFFVNTETRLLESRTEVL